MAALLFVVPTPSGLGDAAWHTAAIGLWMAIWWMSEALPIAATSLLPMVALPVLGVADIRAASAPYANPLIFLFLGGFLIALALEEAGLHRRIALTVLAAVGRSKRRTVLGFMLASAGLSMWISNTATAMMMLPIALSVVHRAASRDGDEPAGDDQAGDDQASDDQASDDQSGDGFALCLLLGIAYACSLGGVATLVGTPTNALLAAFLLESYDFEISFAAWMGAALPICLIGLALVYLALTRWLHPLEGGFDGDAFAAEKAALGAMSPAERRVGFIFMLTAGLWLTRPLLDNVVAGLSDTGIALFGALLLFALPVGRGHNARPVLDWPATRRLPWGVLLLFGGGLSLASAIQSTGLAEWLGGGLGRFETAPIVISLLTVTVIVFLTELTSNTATAAAFLPILASIALGLGENPLLLLVPATIAASCAFMLPVATPPNAIIYGSGQVSLPSMAAAGWRLNLIFIVLITLACQLLLPVVLGVEIGTLPSWVNP